MGKRELRQFEHHLDALQAQIGLCRKGIDENFLVDGFAWYLKKLQIAQPDLEKLGLYEQCRDAILRAEELVKRGPAHDQEAEMLILDTNRALTAASGIREEISKVLSEKPDATADDFKPDPDRWVLEDARKNGARNGVEHD